MEMITSGTKALENEGITVSLPRDLINILFKYIPKAVSESSMPKPLNKELLEQKLSLYMDKLRNDEKSENTKEKYKRDIHKFIDFLSNDEEVTKEKVIEYKQSLSEKYPNAISRNSMLKSLNFFLDFIGYSEYKVRLEKVSAYSFKAKDKVLTVEDFRIIVDYAKSNDLTFYYILLTLGASGMRVSELSQITVEKLKSNDLIIENKGRSRKILLPKSLIKDLLKYAKYRKIKEGSIFLGQNSGKAINRSVVWRKLKKACEACSITPGKGFPHNIRHLFAKVFYSVNNDIEKLSVILGHSSINTTAIYIKSTCFEAEKCAYKAWEKIFNESTFSVLKEEKLAEKSASPNIIVVMSHIDKQR